ncbi:MAG TPA: hypothetical protein VJJ21_03875 [Candidatus Nanoarchaeia archaeon]|nr:hypothetical protein [Candidatus Nanoarchaeia archaeon]
MEEAVINLDNPDEVEIISYRNKRKLIQKFKKPIVKRIEGYSGVSVTGDCYEIGLYVEDKLIFKEDRDSLKKKFLKKSNE